MINFVSLDDRPLFDDEFEVATEELRPVVAEDVVAEVDSVSYWRVDESVTDEEICEVRLLAEFDAALGDVDAEELLGSGMLVRDDSDREADGSAVLAVALAVTPDSECVASVTALSSVETAAAGREVDAVSAIRLVRVGNSDKTGSSWVQRKQDESRMLDEHGTAKREDWKVEHSRAEEWLLQDCQRLERARCQVWTCPIASGSRACVGVQCWALQGREGQPTQAAYLINICPCSPSLRDCMPQSTT